MLLEEVLMVVPDQDRAILRFFVLQEQDLVLGRLDLLQSKFVIIPSLFIMLWVVLQTYQQAKLMVLFLFFFFS